MENNSDNHSINATLMRFEGRLAVLYAQDCGEIRWPLAQLPASVQIGDSITLKLDTNKEVVPFGHTNCLASPRLGLQEEKYMHMKKLLEELIN